MYNTADTSGKSNVNCFIVILIVVYGNLNCQLLYRMASSTPIAISNISWVDFSLRYCCYLTTHLLKNNIETVTTTGLNNCLHNNRVRVKKKKILKDSGNVRIKSYDRYINAHHAEF